MPRPYINVELRRLVCDRAEHICEYCLVSEVDRSSGCQVDHIIRALIASGQYPSASALKQINK